MRRRAPLWGAALAGLWAVGLVGVIMVSEEATVLSRHYERVTLMSGGRDGSRLASAIANLQNTDAASQGRMQKLESENWMEEAMGKDTTHDMDYIKSLKPGDVSVAGFDGLPVIKGVLPSQNEQAAAEALLKSAIDHNTMPTDIDNVWDGKPYVPDEAFNEQISKALAGFHQALGEKKWEKLVTKNCKDAASCKEITEGTHEGYETKWDGKEWTQFDGSAWKPLTHDVRRR